MKNADKIADVMTTEVFVVDISDSLENVKSLFSKQKIRHVPVLSGNKLVGILSKTDILRISFGDAFDNDDSDEAIFEMLSINQVMKHSPVTISSQDSIEEAAKILAENEFHALPVEDSSKLVGIVTTTDIIKYFLKKN